jgi:CubicO group peptidase (beta-lactamase class C family)
VTSVAIDVNGTHEEHYFAGDASTLRNTRSVTKTITGMLVGIAVDRGELSGVDARVLDVLGRPAPDNAGLRKDAITIEDFLAMRSALECDDGDELSAGNEEKMYATRDWVDFALGLPLRETGGFSYCTAGVTALAAVLEAATGASVADYAARALFEPLGIAEVRWAYSPAGLAQTGGGLELRTVDLLRLGALYRDGGRTIVSRAWVERSTRPHCRVDERHEFGYLWWLRDYDGVGSFAMAGRGGNRVVVFPELDAVVVVTSENFERRDAHALTDALLDELVLPALRA